MRRASACKNAIGCTAKDDAGSLRQRRTIIFFQRGNGPNDERIKARNKISFFRFLNFVLGWMKRLAFLLLLWYH